MSVSPDLAHALENRSVWLEGLRRDFAPRGPDALPDAVDVAIVGGGFSGLWTAYYLRHLAPALSIAVIEARSIGFGASGRNGGWTVGSVWQQDARLKGLPDALRRLAQMALYEAVDEIGRVAQAEGIACGYHKGGMLRIAARYPSQMRKLADLEATFAMEHAPSRAATRLDARQAEARVRVRAPLGAIAMPDCAVLNPAHLAAGLADALTRKGVHVVENAQVEAEETRGRLRVGGRRIAADAVVLACEGYNASLPALRNRILPVYAFSLATAPLRDSKWQSIGLEGREAFSDCSPASTYGQRSADGRLVFGALGAYLPRGELAPAWSRLAPRLALVERIMRDLFPQLDGIPVTHRWAGPLGISRHLTPAVLHDPLGRRVVIAGFAGRGVAATNLFGRTAAELVLGRTSERTALPWVAPLDWMDQEFPLWEREPLRWLGAQAMLLPDEVAERVMLSRHAPAWLKARVPGLGKTISRLFA